MSTLRKTELAARISRTLLIAFVALTMGSLLVGFFIGYWSEILTGVVASGAIMATTAFTTGKMAASDGPALGWVGIDYIVKVIIIAATMLLAKFIFVFNVTVVGVVVIVALVVALIAQVGAVLSKQSASQW